MVVAVSPLLYTLHTAAAEAVREGAAVAISSWLDSPCEPAYEEDTGAGMMADAVDE